MKLTRLLSSVCLVVAACMMINCSDPDNEPSGGGDGTSGDDSVGTGGNAEAPQTPGNDESAWTLIFEEDFEGTSREPDTEYWSLCEKGTKSWNRYLSGSYDQAYQENGVLVLLAQKIEGEYLTGGIETRGKFSFTYGKLECNARFVRQPKGNHTGIWMMPEHRTDPWPMCGEIDIMEHLGADDIVYQTEHNWYADEMGHKENPVAQKEVAVDKEQWNTYGLIWTADSLIYTVNGTKYLSYPNMGLTGEDAVYQWPFDTSFYLILTQSLGGILDGKVTWAGPIDDAALPARFEIDWVKVYRKTDE